MRQLLNILILKYKNIIWRKNNKHNFTYLGSVISPDLITIGNATYGIIFAKSWGGNNEKLIIGSYCSIASGVKFLLGGNHLYNTPTTYPFKVMSGLQKEESLSKGPIIVGDDVWIGTDVIILSGVTIGKGAVIGAGALITKNIPPYSIVVGNPARIIKKRFNDDIIQELLKLDYSKIILKKLSKTDIEKLYQPVKSIEDINNLRLLTK